MTAMVELFVSVPIAAFRVPQSREYLETLPVPPPSTVYGMLLSLVGEPDRLAHAGAELALAPLGESARSLVVRTAWRIKSVRHPPGLGDNKRPDLQELLSDVRLAVFVRPGAEEVADPPLAERLAAALADWGSVTRFGGLSLGESSHLVDEVRPLREADLERAWLLRPDSDGDLVLPVWADHVGSARTRWGRFRRAPFRRPPDDDAWVAVAPPG
jgi:CRISPR-associated protein Cas5t